MNTTRRPAGAGDARRGAFAASLPRAEGGAAAVERDDPKLACRVRLMVAMAVAAWALFIGAGLWLLPVLGAAGPR